MMLFEESGIDSGYGREVMTPSQRGDESAYPRKKPGKTKRYLGLVLYLVLCPGNFLKQSEP